MGLSAATMVIGSADEATRNLMHSCDGNHCVNANGLEEQQVITAAASSKGPSCPYVAEPQSWEEAVLGHVVHEKQKNETIVEGQKL